MLTVINDDIKTVATVRVEGELAMCEPVTTHQRHPGTRVTVVTGNMGEDNDIIMMVVSVTDVFWKCFKVWLVIGEDDDTEFVAELSDDNHGGLMEREQSLLEE